MALRGDEWSYSGSHSYEPHPIVSFVYYSDDEGKTWPWKLMYYQGPSGYSDIAVLPDGRVAVLFEKDGKSNLGFTILMPDAPLPE